jgi:hypothetical protein
MSIFLGAPHISEDFIEVSGFWLPERVRSVSSTGHSFFELPDRP